ncbi:MAG TPA: hypothetical protein VK184_20120 [Nostocaceae cyanobacterium]|nr:hypothetical protein [Nostocaceae cyanobacterium]
MMKQQTSEKIEFAGLPLAVYREIAAHLQQITGVKVELITQTATEFNYYDSQISGLCLHWQEKAVVESRQLVHQILTYYQNLYKI